MNRAALILDCGATNVKACLVDETGQMVTSESMANNTISDPYFNGGLIWDVQDIWNKLVICSRKACTSAEGIEIKAIAVTSFGVDGTAVKKDGTLCYPVISWQCKRTEAIEQKISKYFDPARLYKVTGLQSYSFNTLYKLFWLIENRSDVLDGMDYFVMMPSLIANMLTGEFFTDTTMAGTTMLTAIKDRNFSTEVFGKTGLSPDIFPRMVEPGTVIGKVRKEVAVAMGIPIDTPVVAGGHDTQFAMLGSGAGMNEPVLSSGTWEVLMVRASSGLLQIPSVQSGITIELDAVPGFVDIGMQWIASGMLEWVGKLLYGHIREGSSRYSAMIGEAGGIVAGCNGLSIVPEIFTGGFSTQQGKIEGISHLITRAHIYRATLEALSFYARYALAKIQQAGNCKTGKVICVGGGSKNPIWNQIRCDVLGVPLIVPQLKETTAIGAAMAALTGIGVYKNIGEASDAMKSEGTAYLPGKDKELYMELYQDYVEKVFNI